MPADDSKKEDREEREDEATSPEGDEDDLGTEEWIGEDWDEEEDEEQEAPEPEVPAFVDNGNDTISDTSHNLMWAKTDSFQEFGYGINWFEAHEYCEALNEKSFAGFDDWRLPSHEESLRLFSFDQSTTDKDGAEIHISPLFETGGGHNTWTYEEKTGYGQYAMKFSYVTGNDVWENKDNEYSHARPVRDEIKEDYEPEWRKETKKFEG